MKKHTFVILLALSFGILHGQSLSDSMPQIEHCSAIQATDFEDMGILKEAIKERIKSMPLADVSDCTISLLIEAEANCKGEVGNWHLYGNYTDTKNLDECSKNVLQLLMVTLAKPMTIPIYTDIKSGKVKLTLNNGILAVK